MAVPARKVSKTSKRMRRSHDSISSPTTTKCSNCGNFIKPHRACSKCGYYKGKKMIEIKEEKVDE